MKIRTWTTWQSCLLFSVNIATWTSLCLHILHRLNSQYSVHTYVRTHIHTYMYVHMYILQLAMGWSPWASHGVYNDQCTLGRLDTETFLAAKLLFSPLYIMHNVIYILCDILKSFITCRHNIDCRGCERLNNCRLLWKGESHWVRAAPRSLQFTDGGEVQRARLTWHWPKYVPTAHNLKIWFQLAIQADLRTYIASKNGTAQGVSTV